MMLKAFIEGIQILQKYYNDPEGYHLGAEHDQIYLYSTDRPVSEEDLKILVDMGWFQPDINFDGIDDYDDEEGWSCFV